MEEKQLGFSVHEESGMKYKEYEVDGEMLRVFYSDDHGRLEFETYNEYKFRRQVNKYLNKQAKRGRHFWPSVLPTQRGYIGNTYIKEKAERVKEELLNKQKNEQN